MAGLPPGQFTPFVLHFLEGLRKDALQLEKRGAESIGQNMRFVADRLETAYREWAYTWLNLPEAATISGYSIEHLRTLAHDGKMPHQREGTLGHIRVQRCNLPQKAAKVAADPLDRVAKGLGFK